MVLLHTCASRHVNVQPTHPNPSGSAQIWLLAIDKVLSCDKETQSSPSRLMRLFLPSLSSRICGTQVVMIVSHGQKSCCRAVRQSQ